MTGREIEKFLEIATEFLKRHTQSSMVIEGVELWHQKLTLVDAKEGSVTWEQDDGESEEDVQVTADESGEEPTDMSAAPSKRRMLSNDDMKKVSKEHFKNHQEVEVIQVTAVEITLVIKISVSTLPENLLGNMAAVAMNENQEELLSLLNEQAAFYTYFKHMDGIQSHSVEFVTKAPTLSPTTYQYFVSNQVIQTDVETAPEESEGSNFMVFVGLGVAALWCCLTGISLAYLFRVRARMNEENELKQLLSQEKVNPLDAKKEDTDEDVNDQWKENSLSIEPDVENQDAVSESSNLTDSIRDDSITQAELPLKKNETLRPFTKSKNCHNKPLQKVSSIRKMDIRRLRDSGSKVMSIAADKIIASKDNRPKLVTMRSTSLRTGLRNPPRPISSRASDVGARPTFDRANPTQSQDLEQRSSSDVSRRSSDSGCYPSHNDKEENSIASSRRVQTKRGTRSRSVESDLARPSSKMIAARRSSDNGYDPSAGSLSARSAVSRRSSDNGSYPSHGQDNVSLNTSSKMDSKSRPNTAGTRARNARTDLARPAPTKTTRRASFDGSRPSKFSIQGTTRCNAPNNLSRR